jgi:hypothetical protein
MLQRCFLQGKFYNQYKYRLSLAIKVRKLIELIFLLNYDKERLLTLAKKELLPNCILGKYSLKLNTLEYYLSSKII